MIISSGGEKNEAHGISIRYHNKQVLVYVKNSEKTWLGIFTYTMNPGDWYTVDIAWSLKGGIELYINNMRIKGTVRLR